MIFFDIPPYCHYYRAPMTVQDTLTMDCVDPWKLASSEGEIQGVADCTRMDRLLGLLHESVYHGSLTAGVWLSFFMGPDQRPYITGEVNAILPLVCRRCLKPVLTDITTQTDVCVVQDEDEAQRLSEDQDCILMVENGISPYRLAEDELILALPLAACHDDDNAACREIYESHRPEHHSPFEVLKDLID